MTEPYHRLARRAKLLRRLANSLPISGLLASVTFRQDAGKEADKAERELVNRNRAFMRRTGVSAENMRDAGFPVDPH